MKRKSKAPMIVAAVLALALVAGGGFLAWSLLRGAAPAAAKGLPKDTLAVVEVNLNPSAGDKLAVKDLAAKFPALAGKVNAAGDDYKAAVYANTIAALSPDAPDYEADVKPWLGDSVAVGVVKSGDSSDVSSAQPVVSIQVTDKDKAQEFVNAQFSGTNVFFVDDLMILTGEHSGITEESLKNGNLTANEGYTADMAKLGDGFLATAWASEEAISAYAETSMDTSLPANYRGRSAFGLKVEDGSLALRTVTWSENAPKAGGNVTDLAAGLPGDWLGAAAAAVPSEAVDQVWETLVNANDPSIQQGLEKVGITSADDLRTLLGKQISFSGNTDQGMPKFVVKVRTDDPEGHKKLIEDIVNNGLAIGDSGLQVETTVQGDVVVTTINANASELDSGPKLGDNEGYQKAIKGISDPQSVVWVDVPKVVSLVEEQMPDGLDREVKENLDPITGFGGASTRLDDHYTDSWLRITTK
ncbi:MAG: DUF3352 domain-containing protein [Propionibacteriaceae bacterium]|nr:DUF3352 domain-containing protein [Propionibacteriaceae bacterium]